MSYRRAWLLVDGLNRSFNSPPVTMASVGGKGGGGVKLTELGRGSGAPLRGALAQVR